MRRCVCGRWARLAFLRARDRKAVVVALPKIEEATLENSCPPAPDRGMSGAGMSSPDRVCRTQAPGPDRPPGGLLAPVRRLCLCLWSFVCLCMSPYSRCPALCLFRFRTSTALPVVSVCPSLDQTCSRVCPMSDSLVDPFFRLQVSTLTLSRDLTRKREGVTAPGCSLPGQRLFCPPCRHTRPRAGHTALFPFT